MPLLIFLPVKKFLHTETTAFTGDIKNDSRLTYVVIISGILLLTTVEPTNLGKNSNEVKMYSPLFSGSPTVSDPAQNGNEFKCQV